MATDFLKVRKLSLNFCCEFYSVSIAVDLVWGQSSEMLKLVIDILDVDLPVK